MFCPQCGKEVNEGAAFCPYCGAPVGMQSVASAASAAYMTKKEFWDALDKKERSSIMSASIMCYISAGLTMIMGIVSMNFFVLIDVMLVAGLGLWLQLSKSTVAAILLTIYAAYNTIFSLVTMGTPGGWLVLLAGICAIVGCVRFNKAYKAQRN